MLERFLPSVTSCCPDWAEVIVADNGSTDDSVVFLSEHYPSLRIIRLDRNYGFTEGYNRALAQVEADYYVLLNDDVEVTPHWIEPVVELLEKTPESAIAQPKLLMYDRRDTFEYAGAAGGYIDSFGYPFCRGRLFDTLEQDCGQYDDVRPVFWATGAAMFVKAGVWRELGGLDKEFFAHMEEIDFCWRAQNAGYKVLYCPGSTVYHVGGGTLPKSSPHKTFLNFRNNLALLYKNLPDGRVWRVLTVRFMLDVLAALKFLTDGNPLDFAAVFRAHRAFIRWRPALRAKRAAQKHGEVSTMYAGHLLVHYYMKGKHKFSDLKWKEK